MLYGPPARTQPRPYPLVLELLESRANKKLLSEYRTETLSTLAVLEASQEISPSMIDLQPEVQWFMRPFLLDFIVELHQSFKLQPQTLFRCFNIVDRYCAKRIVFKRHYQLVGCTSLWIAAKYEDKKLRIPTLRELAMMCRNAYDEEMFVQMERHILSTLEWLLGKPTLEECLQVSIDNAEVANEFNTPFRYNSNKGTNSSSTTSAVTAVARFLCELSLYSRVFLEFELSEVAIAAHMLASTMIQVPSASQAYYRVVRDVQQERRNQQQDLRVSMNMSTQAMDEENNVPAVHGAFLSGFDLNTTSNTLRKISLLFIQALASVTDVLQNKYKPLGVFDVVQNFVAKHSQLVETVGQMQQELTDFESLHYFHFYAV